MENKSFGQWVFRFQKRGWLRYASTAPGTPDTPDLKALFSIGNLMADANAADTVPFRRRPLLAYIPEPFRWKAVLDFGIQLTLIHISSVFDFNFSDYHNFFVFN